MHFDLVVNGQTRTIDVDPARPLLEVLREELALTGAKYGCGEERCGACTVLVGGRVARACVLPVSAAAGAPITTIEGLERDGRLHPVQQAFLDEGAFQCGYCTPGMIMAAVGLLSAMPAPSAAEVVAAMQPNICRCGTYPRVVAAIRRASSAMHGAGAPAPATSPASSSSTEAAR